MREQLQQALPLLCMSIIASVFANAVYHQLFAIDDFVFALQGWGFEALPRARMVARATIIFELMCVTLLVIAIGTGITDNRRFGHWGWKAGRLTIIVLMVFLQLTIVMYASNDPTYCGCGLLAPLIDGFIQDGWDFLRLPPPRLTNTVPIIRNSLLTFVAMGAYTRGRVKPWGES